MSGQDLSRWVVSDQSGSGEYSPEDLWTRHSMSPESYRSGLELSIEHLRHIEESLRLMQVPEEQTRAKRVRVFLETLLEGIEQSKFQK